MRYRYLLFDLDGTITDPKVGITTCVQYALDSFGIHEPALDKLEPFIGPPLKASFMDFYGFDDRQTQAAVEKYRERFSTVGLYENELYPGMDRLLRELRDGGARLAIASSKPTVFVRQILEHFQIADCFQVVVGSELSGARVEKDEVVAEAVRQLLTRPEDKADTVMIGDRKFDILGGKSLGLHQIGVAYGYGQPGELEEANAEVIVDTVEQLREVLLGQ